MSRVSLPDLELRRAVWRQEYGYLSPRRVNRILASQSILAARDYEALRDRLPVIRKHMPALLGEYDVVRARVSRALELHRNGEALDQILRGRRMIATMQALLAAHARIEAGIDALGRLNAVTAVPRIRALPSFAAPAALLRLARTRMAEGRHRQADYLACEVARQVEALLARHPARDDRHAAAKAAVAGLREVCATTRPLLRDPADDPAADGTLQAMEALLERGLVLLAERLSAELELTLALRAQLHRELTRPGAGDPAAAVAALRAGLGGVPDGEVWSRAVQHLWRSRLAAIPSAPGDDPWQRPEFRSEPITPTPADAPWKI
jgi:hypothetical protein